MSNELRLIVVVPLAQKRTGMTCSVCEAYVEPPTENQNALPVCASCVENMQHRFQSAQERAKARAAN